MMRAIGDHRFLGGLGATLLLTLVLVASGCSEPAEDIEREEVAALHPAPPPEPALRTSADAQLTLFGEFPDRQRVPFHAQAASPMKQHSFTTEGANFDVDTSPDGKWIVFSSTRHSLQPDLYLKTVDGLAVTQLTDDPAADVQPCFSPDGQWVAFASNRAGNWDLWLVGLRGGQATQLTHSPQHELHPSFAPDGKRLAYCMFNERAKRWELWTAALGQPGSHRMIGVGLFPEWSPKADSIVYQRARERGGRWFSIWRMDLVKGEPQFPIELAARSDMALIQPSWSPDSEWVTYGTAAVAPGEEDPESGTSTLSRGDIWIMRVDGSSPLQLTDGQGVHFGSVWGSDQRVYFTSSQNGVENLWSVQPLTGWGEPTAAAAEAVPGNAAADIIGPPPTAGATRQ